MRSETITSEGTRISMERVKHSQDAYFNKNGNIRLVRIWSDERQAYWRVNGAGYTDDWNVADPGIYTLKEAYERTIHCGPEKKIFFEFLPENYQNEKTSDRIKNQFVQIEELEQENRRLKEAITKSLDQLNLFSSFDFGLMELSRETATKILEQAMIGIDSGGK